MKRVMYKVVLFQKGFAFKQSLLLRNVSNVRIVFQLLTFKVSLSGPKTFEKRAPDLNQAFSVIPYIFMKEDTKERFLIKWLNVITETF